MSTQEDSFDGGRLPFGGFPFPKRKIGITISGLEEWKEGIVRGTAVQVDILQKGEKIHSEVFSGKSSGQFTRQVVINASSVDLVAVHNRPDLPNLKVSVDFIAERNPFTIKNGVVFISEALNTRQMCVGVKKLRTRLIKRWMNCLQMKISLLLMTYWKA
ncbi:hypothetical protein ACFQUX_18245 [Pantoea stewartii]|uniref:hypothetical protein n=1 Tax=Pantoea stewartii TaxID=66269 RepID=UPI00361C8BFD